MALEEYRRKRNFKLTTEPSPKVERAKTKKLSFVVQKHYASHLHYDFRLELDGVLKSWAVPKGPSMDPAVKRLAIEVEDHPLAYGKFEGSIPKGEYGAGKVILWDRGVWSPSADPRGSLKAGRLEFELKGEKLNGKWILVRTRPAGKVRHQWLLIKRLDRWSEGGTKTARHRKSKRTKAKLKFCEPQLAQLSAEPPTESGWVHEVKFDGYRTLIRLESGEATYFTRSGLDWSQKYKSLNAALRDLPASSAWLDGEICVLDGSGHTRFHDLQYELTKSTTDRLVYYAFDLLELDGVDLRKKSLLKRKAALRKLLADAASEKILFSEHWEGNGKELLAVSCDRGLEGVVSKRSDATYTSGRIGTWVKTKCRNAEEVLIIGYSVSDEGAGFKSLLLGEFDGKGSKRTLRYIGRVGTGFDRAEMNKLVGRFKPLIQSKSPLPEKIDLGNQWRKADSVVWLKPKLLAKIEFRGWTRDRLLRQASYIGLREDKRAKPKAVAENTNLTKPVKLTNPGKILIPGVNITKADLFDYYHLVQNRMLPHIAGRPLSMLRCPEGIRAKCFFQKHLHTYHPPQLETGETRTPKGKADHLIYLETVEGLEALAQLGVLEIHTRGTHHAHPDAPDLIVFDLDPGPKVPWKNVVKGTYLIRDTLESLGLESFVKTSGGKGFHIHVPIAPIYSWEQVKNFAKTVAQHLSRKYPKMFVASVAKSKRTGKIFIDYLRNGYGATAIAPFAVRARPGGPVAMPISWAEVATTKPSAFRLKELLKNSRVLKNDPWKGYFKIHQEITILSEDRPTRLPRVFGIRSATKKKSK